MFSAYLNLRILVFFLKGEGVGFRGLLVGEAGRGQFVCPGKSISDTYYVTSYAIMSTLIAFIQEKVVMFVIQTLNVQTEHELHPTSFSRFLN